MTDRTPMQEYRRTVTEDFERRVQGLNFQRGRRPSWIRSVDTDIVGVLIPNWRSFGRHLVVGLELGVGVLDVPLEAEIARRAPFARAAYATHQTLLWNIVPHESFPQGDPLVLFEAGQQQEDAMNWLMTAIATDASRWIADWAVDDALTTELLRLDDYSGRAREFRIGVQAPLLELRRGEPAKALERLDRHSAAIESRADEIGEAYRAFAAKLRQELAAA